MQAVARGGGGGGGGGGAIVAISDHKYEANADANYSNENGFA
jgi:hypothetical protein